MKLTALLLLCLSFQVKGSDAQGSGKLVCYAELWAGRRPTPGNFDLNKVPPRTCDYLILTYLTMDPETWTLRLHNGYTNVEADDLHKASKLRERSPGMKVLVAVGGWADGVAKYSEMISEASRRKAFVNSVVDTLRTYNLDGLELSWLYPGVNSRGGGSGDKFNFVRLVVELVSAFKETKWVVTASVPPDEDTVKNGYNVKILNSLLHQMHVRTIDMRGDWLDFASSHCPLYSSSWEKSNLRYLNVNGSLSMWERLGASRRKLLPTFPFYGRSFTLKDRTKTEPGSPILGQGQSTPILRVSGISAYLEICDGVQSGQMIRHYQTQAESPYAVKGEYWVGYEDEESLEKKVKLVIEKEYAGAAVFAISMDDFAGTCGRSHFLLHKMRELLNEGLPKDKISELKTCNL